MPSGEPLSMRQRHDVERAIEHANAVSGLSFSVYVGDLEGGRPAAVRMHESLHRAASAVLVAVDPARRQLEIVTGAVATRALDKRACSLGAVAMTSAFSQGDLVGGLVRGVQLLGSHGRHDRVLHTDEP